MDAEKLPKIVALAIESALASGRQLSWKVQENKVGMMIQLVWKSSEFSSVVGSNWNNHELRKKAPSRQRRDALRLLKFNAAKAPLQVLEHSSVTENSSNVQLQGQESFAATVTPRTISPTEQLLADEQATTVIPSTTSIAAADSKPREVSSVQVSQLPEIRVHGPSPTRPLPLPPLNLPETLPNVSRYHTDYFRCNDGESASIVKTCMERDWCSVVQAGQVVKVKMRDKLTVDRLFVAKLASNGAYFYVTAKVIVRASDDSTAEVQFRDMLL